MTPRKKPPDDIFVSDIPLTESNDDWLRALRLKDRAEQGDEEARREFERMDSSVMVPLGRKTSGAGNNGAAAPVRRSARTRRSSNRPRWRFRPRSGRGS